MTLSSIVSRNLRALRSRRKLTQGALAEKAGVTPGYISMLESGQRIPPLETLEKIAKAFNVPPLSLLKKLSPGRRARRR